MPWHRNAIVLLSLAALACNKPTQRAARQDAVAKVHDETETHYYVVVKRDAFAPDSIIVPPDTDLILELYFDAATECTSIALQAGDNVIERNLETARTAAHASRTIDLHVRFPPGSYDLRCLDAKLHATVTTQTAPP